METHLTLLGHSNETMSSLQIAEITGKQHAHVLRDIRALLEQGVQESNFGLSSYTQALPNGASKQVTCYNLTKKGCLILASGYDALLREKIINRWEELETKNQNGGYEIPQTYSQALLLASRQAELIDEQKKLIAQNTPKVNFANAVVASSSSCLIGELAKIITQNGYTIGQNRLFEWLRNNGYLGKYGEYRNMPNQQYVEQGLFEVKKSVHSENGVLKTTTTTKVTGKGQIYFINKFLKNKVA